MSNKAAGIVLMVVGVVLVALGLLADVIGVGGSAGLGWKQLVMTGAGVVVVIVGAWWGRRKRG